MRRFKGVFIPDKIWNNESIDIISRCILAEIDARDSGEGADIDEKKIAALFGVTTKMIEKRTLLLEANGMLKSEKGRLTSLAHEAPRIIIRTQKEAREESVSARKIPDLSKYVAKNIAEYRGTRSKPFVSMRALFLARYAEKSNDLTGQPVAAEWNGKEGALLKKDLQRCGITLIERAIELFFSDNEPQVANFTRYEKKAGYSYSIFHSMLDKLMVSKADPLIPCEHCGQRRGHDRECVVEITKREQEAEQRKRYEEERAKVENVDLQAMLKERIGGRK